MATSAAAFAPTFGNSRATTSLDARKPFISGNWKLNPATRDEAVLLASGIASAITPDSPDADVALFVPYPFIEAASNAVGGKLSIGAEVSPVMETCAYCRADPIQNRISDIGQDRS